jgi:hypothetical protein
MYIARTYCSVLAGPTIPVPLPATFADAIRSVEVIQCDSQSGFQIEFTVGRQSTLFSLDYPIMESDLLQPFNRLSIFITINMIPQLLMDGIITYVQLNPRNDPGTSILTVTGRDLSVLMDQEEKVLQYPGQSESAIATQIIGKYEYLGIVPEIITPPLIDTPNPSERIPVQRGTDLAYLRTLAARFGYIFYVTTGPKTNTAYWGPPTRVGLPQSALSINLGPESNIKSIDFQYDALSPVTVQGEILDSVSDLSLPYQTLASTELPLAQTGIMDTNARTIQLQAGGGFNYQEAFARAQGTTNQSRNEVVVATGELDVARYGGPLQACSLVGVRGSGWQYDGTYYVQETTHQLGPGFYTQQFRLTREGTGALSPVVNP